MKLMSAVNMKAVVAKYQDCTFNHKCKACDSWTNIINQELSHMKQVNRAWNLLKLIIILLRHCVKIAGRFEQFCNIIYFSKLKYREGWIYRKYDGPKSSKTLSTSIFSNVKQDQLWLKALGLWEASLSHRSSRNAHKIYSSEMFFLVDHYSNIYWKL